jgi:hypothetical protein
VPVITHEEYRTMAKKRRGRHLFLGHDLQTHAGLEAAGRAMRDRMLAPDNADELFAKLAVVRPIDPHPVVVMTPFPPKPTMPVVGIHTREDVKQIMGTRSYAPQFWDLMSAERQQPGTVYFFIRHGGKFFWFESVIVTPEMVGKLIPSKAIHGESVADAKAEGGVRDWDAEREKVAEQAERNIRRGCVMPAPPKFLVSGRVRMYAVPTLDAMPVPVRLEDILRTWESDPVRTDCDREFIEQMKRRDLPAGSFFLLVMLNEEQPRPPGYLWKLCDPD